MRAWLTLVVLLGACDAYDHDLGSAPFLCGPDAEKRCPADYTCIEDPNTGDEICVASASITSAVDCADDSAIEPNELLTKATPTSGGSYSHAELAICPPTDVDTFAVPITSATGIDLEVVIGAGATLRATILNDGGVPIATATFDERTHTLSASANQLRPGSYYARVSSPNGRANNYSIEIRTH